MFKIISNLSDKSINKAVNDVLNSPRFINAAKQETVHQDKDGNFFTRFLDSLDKFIEKIFKKFHIKPPKVFESLFGSGSFAAYLIESIIFFLILGIITFFIVKFFLKREKIKLKQYDNAQMIDVNADYYTMAQEANAKSDIKAAIRFLFLAILVNLSKLDLIKIDAGKTNYQYFLELKKNKTDKYNGKNFISEFRNCILIFNEIWYGKKIADPQKYDTCKGFYEEIASSLGGRIK